jgi:hypothetical protein
VRSETDLIEALADMPGLATDIVAGHRRTPEGRCPLCTAGPQKGHVVHPCRLYSLAKLAQAEIAERRGRA